MKVKAWVDEKGQVANWGDLVNSVLVEFISGITPELKMASIREVDSNYLVVGSILQWADRNSIVWGAGFMGDLETCTEPLKICAVRGPLTRERLGNMGMSCPKVYGDPVLLISKYYKPNIEKKYTLGIIPHWQDQFYVSQYPDSLCYNPNYWKLPEGVIIIPSQDRDTLKAKGTPSFNEQARNGIFKFIDMICSCERIASSSLHGLICADAYGIPNVQISILHQSNFKYHDYFLSVNRKIYTPIDCRDNLDFNSIFGRQYYGIEFDANKLLEACPFKEVEEEIQEKENEYITVTRDMALDAGDPKLEGEKWRW